MVLNRTSETKESLPIAWPLSCFPETCLALSVREENGRSVEAILVLFCAVNQPDDRDADREDQ